MHHTRKEVCYIVYEAELRRTPKLYLGVYCFSIFIRFFHVGKIIANLYLIVWSVVPSVYGVFVFDSSIEGIEGQT